MNAPRFVATCHHPAHLDADGEPFISPEYETSAEALVHMSPDCIVTVDEVEEPQDEPGFVEHTDRMAEL
jgi:hypothetical protein